MRVLQVFNRYRQRGGEETVVALEAELLRQNGHHVECLSASTSTLDHASALHLLAAGLGTVWSVNGYSEVWEAVQRFSPDVLHVHNTFPLLSPSIYWAASRAKIPVVCTLHNFRLTCANACLVRDGKTCSLCVGSFGWAALRHRCFRSSVSQTSAIVAMNAFHRWVGTYQQKVQAFIALSLFSHNIFIQAGLPPERVWVKPNFVPEQNIGEADRSPDMLYVGEISRMKGVHILLNAWQTMALPTYRLTLIGEGPDRRELQEKYAAMKNIIWLGQVAHGQVLETMAASRWLVLPSLCFENFPMVLLEAWSVGTPVIAPNHGAFPDIISVGENGFLFTPGDPHALREALRNVASIDSRTWKGMSSWARRKCRSTYAAKENYRQLISIYRKAMARQDYFPRQAPESHSERNDSMLKIEAGNAKP